MKRNISVLDFPTLVATKIIDDAKRGKRFRPNPPPPLRYDVENLAGQSIIFTETDYGNLTFTCPNCKRKNILAKQKVVLAMCKFCQPPKSPD